MTAPLELFANSPVPGTEASLAVLQEEITTRPAPGTVEVYAVSAAAPPDLRAASGQFRVLIDREIMIVAASLTGASPWTFIRGQEGTIPEAHSFDTPIYNTPTAGAMRSLQAYAAAIGATAAGLTDAERARAMTAEALLEIAGAGTFVFNQLTPSKVWLIPHNLDAYPPVFTIDSADTPMYGDVDYPDLNTATVTFDTPEAGTAYLAK